MNRKRCMARVRAYVEAQRSTALKAKPSYHSNNIYPNEVSTTLSIPVEDVTSCLDEMVHQAQPLIGQRSRSGFRRKGQLYYPMLGMPLPPFVEYEGDLFRKPRKQRPSWNTGKRRALAIIRKDKPWVIEKFWPEPDNRFFLYMEDKAEIRPEDQPQLTRTMIARWHFTLEKAVEEVARVRRRYPNAVFRIRDTSAGDYVMGYIL